MDTNKIIDDRTDSCSYNADRFFSISVETDIQLHEKEQNLWMSPDCLEKLFRR